MLSLLKTVLMIAGSLTACICGALYAVNLIERPEKPPVEDE